MHFTAKLLVNCKKYVKFKRFNEDDRFNINMYLHGRACHKSTNNIKLRYQIACV